MVGNSPSQPLMFDKTIFQGQYSCTLNAEMMKMISRHLEVNITYIPNQERNSELSKHMATMELFNQNVRTVYIIKIERHC